MIETTGLTKTFRHRSADVHAVRGIDVRVDEGELVALLGPNGAGKSTTLRMLTTLLSPTAGSARIAGFDVTEDRDRVRRRIGYVGQGNGAGHNQRVVDELVVQGQCYGMTRRAARERADELVGALQLDDLAMRTVSTLSGGQRRRLDIALGLVHRPPLLFLDEPTTGMDPQSRANLWDHILRLRREMGTTIVLTTHYLDEADSMAERVIVIDRGTVIADDTADALKSDLAGDLIVLTASDGPALAALLDGVAGVRDVTTAGPRLNIRVERADMLLPELLRLSDSHGIEVSTAEMTRPTLDDVFLGLTGRSLRESAAAGGSASLNSITETSGAAGELR